MPDSPSLQFGQALTVEFWMWVNQTPQSGSGDWVLAKSDGGPFAVGIGPGAGPSYVDIGFRLVEYPDWSIELGASLVDRTQRWVHFAAILDTNQTVARLYIDGQLEAEQTAYGDGTPIPLGGTLFNNTLPLRIGGRLPDNVFDGRMDEIRIWNVARTQEQIRATLFQRLNGNESGLVGYWRFDEGAGQVILDSSPFGNHGFLGTSSSPDGSDPTRIASDAPLGTGELSPSILQPPTDQTVAAGQSVTWTVQADGTPPLTYQWRRNGQPLTDGGAISGATTNTLTIHSACTSAAGSYDVVVSNNCDATISAAATLAVLGGAGRLYVRANAPAGGDGASWATAYRDLQTALANAACGTMAEIWVAAGAYKPTGGSDRTASFQLVNGVGIYGGFSGSETQRDQRNPVLHVTILSGDLGTSSFPFDNSYHVVNGSGTDATAVLDGFTIRAGYANGLAPEDLGAGIFIQAGSPTLAHCIIQDNDALQAGGGLYAEQGSQLLIQDCTFESNSAIQDGGGLYLIGGSDATLRRCVIRDNTTFDDGAGLHLEASNPLLENCRLIDNGAAYAGGALFCNSASPVLRNCVLSGNDGGTVGGAICAILDSSPQLANCTVIHNVASDEGGGLYLYKGGTPRLTNCILWNNDATLGPQLSLYCTEPVDLAVVYSVIEGGQAAIHTVAGCVVTWGPGNQDLSPLVLADGHLTAGSICIDAGDPSGDYSGQTDLDGEPRVHGPRVDIGADECDGCPLLGDLNCDGELDFFDLDPFILALTNPALYQAQFALCDITLADANLDGAIDFFDIDPFVALLVGG